MKNFHSLILTWKQSQSYFNNTFRFIRFVKVRTLSVYCVNSLYKLQYNFTNKVRVTVVAEHENKFKTFEFDMCGYELRREYSL